MIGFYRFFFCMVIFLLAGIGPGYAQVFDYDPYPRLDFSFNHLELELRVDTEQQLLEGRALYEVEANIESVDTLVMHAAHMDIEDVRIDGSAVRFQLQNDSLIVETDGVSGDFTLEIFYESTPGFGIHFDRSGRVWTSFLPLSTRHWVPVFDHPRVSFTTDMTVTVPGEMTVLGPGRMASEQIVSVDEKEVRWQSRQPVPASALWFAAGPFRKRETSLGIKRIVVSGGNEVLRQQILEQAYDLTDRLEERLGFEYPFESLHVILLDDHRWEAKPYGAGAVYLFGNRGSLSAQLLRGVYAQWFGVFQREEQWSDAEAMNLFQTALHAGSEDQTMTVSESETPLVANDPYAVFGPRHWNTWQQFYSQWSDTTWKEVVSETLRGQLSEGRGVRSWSDYAEHWYRESGQPWFETPALDIQNTVSPVDSVGYRVEYRYDDISNELVLGFNAIGEASDELITLPLVQYTGSGPDSLEVTFTGSSDSVMIRLDPAVRYVNIDASGRENFFLQEIKPVSFLLNLLRSDEPDDTRAEAARQLAEHAENPDLQLAVRDFLSGEEDPGVRAALLFSLGEITQGSIGTEQLFLDELRSEHPSVQQAALSALRHFQERDGQIVQALGSYAIGTDSLALFNRAIESFGSVADTASVRQLIGRIVETDTTGVRTVSAIRALSGWMEAAERSERLDLLLSDRYPYRVRSEALNLLVGPDGDRNRWTSRFPDLVSDPDPRIRLLAARAAGEAGLTELFPLIRRQLPEEYDGRVYYEMTRILGEQE